MTTSRNNQGTILQRVSIAAILAAVLAFYLWTASSNHKPFEFKFTGSSGYYGLLAEAFLARQVSLLVEPSKELLRLSDPYDPSLNAPFRLHDACLYRGKYYLYWGPVPALVLHIPFRLLFGKEFPENLSVALFCFGGLFWSFLLLNFLTQTYLPLTSFWMRALSLVCLSLCNVAPFILRRPVIYEAAISGGYCFLFAGLYYYASGGLGENIKPWRLLLGSLFMGLAIGSRLNLIFAGLIPLLLWIKALRSEGFSFNTSIFKNFLYLFSPLALCMLLLGIYNYARFGSATDSGLHYALAGAGINAPKFTFFDRSRIVPDLFFYLLST